MTKKKELIGPGKVIGGLIALVGAVLLWILVSGVVCWWFGSGGQGGAAEGERTLFQKLAVLLTGGWISVALDLVWTTLVIMAGITAVYVFRKISTLSPMTPVGDPRASIRAPEPRDVLERQIQSMNFHYLGDFDATSISGIPCLARAYCDSDRMCAAMLVDTTAAGQKTTVLEFGTNLHPLGSITTSTSPFPSIFSYPTERMVARVPWKTTVMDVFALHQSLCRTAREEHFEAETLHAGGFAESVRKDERQGLEYQVRVGRFKRVAEDQYRSTLWGTIIAVPLIWWQMCYGSMFSWVRIPDGFFRWRFRRRLRRISPHLRAAPALHIGACSWAYDSWRGLVYSDNPGRRLQEYAQEFDTVEIDQWFPSLPALDTIVLPEPSIVAAYAVAVPAGFRFGVKLPNTLTLPHGGWNQETGSPTPNPHFLSNDLLDRFLERLRPMQGKLGPLLLQFGSLDEQDMPSQEAFLDKLAAFVGRLPAGYTWGIDIRNPDYLDDSYFQFLQKHGLSHVWLHGYNMPSIFEVYEESADRLTDDVIIRLDEPERKGFDGSEIVEPRDADLNALATMVKDLQERRRCIWVFVSNHFEGCAPRTIQRIRKRLE